MVDAIEQEKLARKLSSGAPLRQRYDRRNSGGMSSEAMRESNWLIEQCRARSECDNANDQDLNVSVAVLEVCCCV